MFFSFLFFSFLFFSFLLWGWFGGVVATRVYFVTRIRIQTFTVCCICLVCRSIDRSIDLSVFCLCRPNEDTTIAKVIAKVTDGSHFFQPRWWTVPTDGCGVAAGCDRLSQRRSATADRERASESAARRVCALGDTG